jgi:hypothetical protein
MKAAGLELKRPDLIASALASLEKNQFDSDEDDVLDVDELRQGRNPNQPGPGFLCATYGCGAQIAPHRSPSIGASPHAIALMLMLAGVSGRAWLRRRTMNRRSST